MKWAILSSIIAAALTVAAVSAAEPTPKPATPCPRSECRFKLRTDFWYHVAATPAYVFWVTNLHEGSHAITGMTLGYKVSSYKPYPHTFTDTDGQRCFMTGRVVFEGMPTKPEVAAIAAVPAITGIAAFVASDAALGMIDPDSTAAPFLLFGGMFWPYAQFAWSTLSPAQTDLRLWSDATGMSRGIATAASVSLVLVGTVRLAYRGYQVLRTEDRTDDSRATKLMLVPTVSPHANGFALIGSF